MRNLLFALSFITMSGCSGQSTADPDLIGVWRGTNDLGSLVEIEFTTSGEYLLSVDGNGLTNQVAETGPVKYDVARAEEWLRIALFGARNHDSFGTLQAHFISENQMELKPVLPEDAKQPNPALTLERRSM